MFIVLTTNMVALSRGCKPRILFSRRDLKIDKSRDHNIAIVTKTIFDFFSLFFSAVRTYLQSRRRALGVMEEFTYLYPPPG